MAKTPRTRHSTSKTEPVTIDLEAVRTDTPDDERQDPGARSTMAPEEASSGPKAAEEAPETVAEAMSEATPAPKSRSGGGALLGGVIGGVVALLLGGGLQYAGILPSLNPKQQTGAGVEALQQQLSTLQGEVTALRAAPPAPAETSLDAALAEPLQEIASLRQSVQSLQQKVATQGDGGAEVLTALEQKRTELEASFADLSKRLSDTGAADSDLAQRVQTAEADMATLRQAVSTASTKMNDVVSNVQSFTGRLDDLSTQVAKQDEGPKVALVVAASSLKSAIERGSPFASELETYSSLAPNAADFDQLRPFAEQGIPTLNVLTLEASNVASQIASAASAPDASAGFVDRLMSSALSVVKVRPVGEVAGDGPAEIAARMEAAVKRGDLAAAIREFDALPPASQALGTDFSKQLRARAAATQILDEALSTALKPA